MIVIRPIREEDAAQFHAVLDAVCRERRFLATFEAPPLEQVQGFVTGNVRAGHPQFVAEAEETGRIVGWCDAIPGDATTGVQHIGRLGMGLLPEYRNRKIGRRLIAATLDRCRTLGLEKVELTVYASNAPALALYRSLGFGEEGRKVRGRLVDGSYDDVLLMALFLKPAK